MKRKYINTIIITLVFVVFLIQYYIVTNYINELFQYTTFKIRNDALNNEIKNFKMYMFENFIFLILQSLGMFVSLNIGFLYFKFKIHLKDIFNLVTTSLVAFIINQVLLILIVKWENWTFLISSFNSASEKLNLTSYIKDVKKTPWIELSLSSINIEQILVLVILTISIHKILKLSLKKALSITTRTYGLGILIWFVFAMVMEMNFS